MILDTIVKRKLEDLILNPLKEDEFAELRPSTRGFKEAIKGKGQLSLIAELKKSSPSEGVINENFDYLEIAGRYVQGGATCFSILTEEHYFLGSLAIMREVSEHFELPVLRKDFIIDPLQVDEARKNGADCVLLIARILSPEIIRNCQKRARALNMDVLLEVHNEEELRTALGLPQENLIIGVNNRDLDTLKINLSTCLELCKMAPDDCVLVAESGYENSEQLSEIKGNYDAVLMGTTLMRSNNPAETLHSLFANI